MSADICLSGSQENLMIKSITLKKIKWLQTGLKVDYSLIIENIE